MRGLLKRRIWSWVRRRGVDERWADARLVLKCRADFARRYGEICEACAVLEPSPDAAARLACDYMSRVLADEHEAEWWRVRSVYAAQPWFVWTYCRNRGMVAEPEPADAECCMRVIRPEAQQHPGCVYLSVKREPMRPAEGLLRVEYAFADEGFGAVLRTRNLRWKDGGFMRRINEWAAPISDRAVENAVRLIDDGYTVCVAEPALADAIAARSFEPEYRYWVLATSQPDKLRLVYPRDQKLHRYVCQAGAHWNGKYMEIAVCHADRLEELARLYGFRMTGEVRRRLDAWHEAVRQATVLSPRHSRSQEACVPPSDMFRELLERDIAVIDDLRDQYE